MFDPVGNNKSLGDTYSMRNLFAKVVESGDGLFYTSDQPLPFSSAEFRDITRSSVLYLSAFITAGGFVNIVRREEPHIEMWLSLLAATLTLIFVWRVPSSSRHMVTSLHVLMAMMVANISVQVIHGIHYQLMCVLPFYLIWIGLLPTVLVALGGVLVTSITILLAGENPLIPENVMLAIATCMVVHFAKVQVRQQLHLASSDVLTGALNRRYLRK